MPDVIATYDFNEAAITWCAMWAIATGFTGWNCWDSWHDWRANKAEDRPREYIAAARWFFRQDLFKTIALGCVLIAGVCATLRMVDASRSLLFLGGWILTFNQILNRLDRHVVKQLAEQGWAIRSKRDIAQGNREGRKELLHEQEFKV